jgi:3D (Asp-Asp-Asp) domain-containing protein
MEGKKRSPALWIVLAILAVVLCCVAIAVALLIGLFSFAPSGGIGRTVDERTEQSFDVGPSPSLVVNNFAGNVTVQGGEGSTIQVTATKRARRQANLARINVSMQQTDQGVEITSRTEGINTGNLSVELEIRVPAGTRVQIELGAGQIVVRDTGGEIKAHTGAGTVDVSGGIGPIRLETGAGTVSYRGAAQGDYVFQTGVGEITIALPADAAASVNLTTGLGRVTIEFPVAGTVNERSVQGTIGGGGQATIEAHTGTGSIKVVKQ